MAEQVQQPEQPPRNAGELYTQCRRRFGLMPEEVVGLLGFSKAAEMRSNIGPGVAPFANYEEAWAAIESRLTLPSGRILRAEPSLDKALAYAERKAWHALAANRNQEYGHWAEMWATLAKISGKALKNPFTAVAALGRAHRQQGGRD